MVSVPTHSCPLDLLSSVCRRKRRSVCLVLTLGSPFANLLNTQAAFISCVHCSGGSFCRSSIIFALSFGYAHTHTHCWLILNMLYIHTHILQTTSSYSNTIDHGPWLTQDNQQSFFMVNDKLKIKLCTFGLQDPLIGLCCQGLKFFFNIIWARLSKVYYLKAVVYIPILFVELHHISREAVQITFSTPNSRILHDYNKLTHTTFSQG